MLVGLLPVALAVAVALVVAGVAVVEEGVIEAIKDNSNTLACKMDKGGGGREWRRKSDRRGERA